MSLDSKEKLMNNPEVRMLIDKAYMEGIKMGIQMSIEHLKFLKEVGLPKLKKEAEKIAKEIKEGKISPKIGNA